MSSKYQLVLSVVMVRFILVDNMITRLSQDPLSYSRMSALLRLRQSSSSSCRTEREVGALGQGFIFLLALWATFLKTSSPGSLDIFVNNVKRRRTLYLILVRSRFEHCSQIWHPSKSTLIVKFENVQKKCLKWILFEEEMSYSSKDVYIRKCKQVKFRPMNKRFVLNDLILFHNIINNLNQLMLLGI